MNCITSKNLHPQARDSRALQNTLKDCQITSESDMSLAN